MARLSTSGCINPHLMSRRGALCAFGAALTVSITAYRSRLFAQEVLYLSRENSCDYLGGSTVGGVEVFPPSESAKDIVAKIVGQVFIPQNFAIRSADVSNANAVVEGDNRYILYSQSFMEMLEDTTQTYWSAFGVLAHEVGHHLAGHTLTGMGSRPDWELEADRFSGATIARLAGGLDDATAAVRRFASIEGSATHPPRGERVQAIASGWQQVRGQVGEAYSYLTNNNEGSDWHVPAEWRRTGNQWIEYQFGKPYYYFSQVDQDNDFIYIYDSDRGAKIAIPRNGGTSYIDWQNGGWVEFKPMKYVVPD